MAQFNFGKVGWEAYYRAKQFAVAAQERAEQRRYQNEQMAIRQEMLRLSQEAGARAQRTQDAQRHQEALDLVTYKVDNAIPLTQADVNIAPHLGVSAGYVNPIVERELANKEYNAQTQRGYMDLQREALKRKGQPGGVDEDPFAYGTIQRGRALAEMESIRARLGEVDLEIQDRTAAPELGPTEQLEAERARLQSRMRELDGHLYGVPAEVGPVSQAVAQPTAGPAEEDPLQSLAAITGNTAADQQKFLDDFRVKANIPATVRDDVIARAVVENKPELISGAIKADKGDALIASLPSGLLQSFRAGHATRVRDALDAVNRGR